MKITGILPHLLSLPLPRPVTTSRPARQDLFTEPLVVRDGSLLVPDKPGIGLGLSASALARYRV